jgi:hypothetical protein
MCMLSHQQTLPYKDDNFFFTIPYLSILCVVKENDDF